MPKTVPLPNLLTARPFTNATARSLGLGAERLRSDDLIAPFYGLHVTRAAAYGDEAGPGSFGGSSPSTQSKNDDERLGRAALRRCQAFGVLLRPGERFSHTTAALLWGADLPRSVVTAPLHVSVPDPARARRARGVIGHTMPSGETGFRHGLPVTDPAHTWLAAAQLLPEDELVALGDHLVRIPVYPQRGEARPYVTRAELTARVEIALGRGSARARNALPLLSEAAESRPESLLRLLLHRGGLPKPDVNPDILDAAGRRIGRADLVFRPQRVIVEYDGQQHRRKDTQYEKDATRLELFHLDDWHVIRVRKHGLFAAPQQTLAHVRETLLRRERARRG